MKKEFILSLLLCLPVILFAQEEADCSSTKKNHYHLQLKKTRASAYNNTLMEKYDVHAYFLDVHIERDTTAIDGKTGIAANILSTLDTFCFELNANLDIDSIAYNGQNMNHTRVANITYVHFSTPLPIGTNALVEIWYHGDANVLGGSAIGDGFTNDNSPSWGNEVTWSLSQPYSAYEWFPCKQFLMDKADSAWIFITTDIENLAGSNGVLEGIDSGLVNNKIRFRWKTRYPIDYYLISVAVAKYVDYTIYAHPSALLNDSVPIQSFVYNNPQTLPFVKSRIDTMALALEYFSDLLGLYPFHKEKYGHCMAPLGGGMEHQTMSTMGNFNSFRVNAHELMHQWFGDYVTCKSWSDIFINEGFASYGEYLAYEHFRGLTAAQNRMEIVHDDILSLPNAAVYFTDTNDVNRIFDGTQTYNKGSAVIHTLRFIMGDSLFFSGLKLFLQQYANGNASILDLKNSLQNSSSMVLDDYFNQWLFGEGHPIYSAEYFSDSSNVFLIVSHTTSSNVTPLYKTPLEIKLLSNTGDTIIKINVEQNIDTFIIPIPKVVTNLEFDPNNWLLNTTDSITMNPNLQALNVNNIEYVSSLKVYPNPVSDELTISTNGSFQYKIYNAQGVIVTEGKANLNQKISTTQWQTGSFWVEVMINGKVRSTKAFVKK